MTEQPQNPPENPSPGPSQTPSPSQPPNPSQYGSQPQYGNQPQTPPPPPQAPYKRLTRSTWDAPISGVCGGVAQYLGIDPTVVRVLAAIAMLATFPVGPIVYVVLWATLPTQ